MCEGIRRCGHSSSVLASLMLSREDRVKSGALSTSYSELVVAH